MKKLILLFAILMPFIACNQSESSAKEENSNEVNKAQLAKEINELEVRIIKALDAKKEDVAAGELIKKSEEYVRNFPKDSLAPIYLFKAADVARGLGVYGKAIKMWGQVWRDFNDFRRAPDALFLQGFTFDNDLGDQKMARKYYESFLEHYPTHELTPQVKQLLAVLGKSPEDLIKEFKKGSNEE